MRTSVLHVAFLRLNSLNPMPKYFIVLPEQMLTKSLKRLTLEIRVTYTGSLKRNLLSTRAPYDCSLLTGSRSNKRSKGESRSREKIPV